MIIPTKEYPIIPYNYTITLRESNIAMENYPFMDDLLLIEVVIFQLAMLNYRRASPIQPPIKSQEFPRHVHQIPNKITMRSHLKYPLSEIPMFHSEFPPGTLKCNMKFPSEIPQWKLFAFRWAVSPTETRASTISARSSIPRPTMAGWWLPPVENKNRKHTGI